MTVNSQAGDAVHDFAQQIDLSLISKVIDYIVSEAIVVTKRQLCDFLSDGQYDSKHVLSNVEKEIAHCPLNNLIGESSFGDFDFDLSKRRHASLHNRSSLHMVKRNKTMNFLTKKTSGQQRNILALARKYSQKYRKHSRKMEEKATNQIRQRFVEN
ncbi:hypothetical protein RRG08_061288 [Elysia crispata]|uniref:Uncharacterized protein n=1 Tax=Elysia crispata TaxID=231223 RepID=A0AAE0YFQ0_9GAST|nr:hypothetical protein RRG08_061288 [Elysia crispata]